MKKVEFSDGSKYYEHKGFRVDFDNGEYVVEVNEEQGQKLFAKYGSNVFATLNQAKEAINYLL